MKLKNLITIGLMCLLVGLTVGCDEDVDVGGEDLLEKAGSVVSLGFNINAKLIDLDGFQAAYPSEQSDWVSDATMDAIDAVWVLFHKGTSNVKFDKIAPAIFDVKADGGNGTGVVYVGIASADLASSNGLTLDVRFVKYRDGYDGTLEKDCADKIYYLGALEDYVVINGNVSLGYANVFDVTVDSVRADLDVNASLPF